MTLYRQLLTAVIVLFLLLYSVNTLINIRSHAELVEQQMQAHAHDTATSLALSMTQAALAGEMATMDTMFSAVSDRGYFHRIEFVDLDGNIPLEREFPVFIERVPDWFVRLIPLAAPPASAEVTSGWMRLGRVNVFSYPGQAYATLWSLAVRQFVWFSVVTALVLLLSALALRMLLRPLNRVELQAEAICNQQFPVQDKLPRTRELARVVDAMNRMARRLRELFESQLAQISRLQEKSFRDPVTGLSNREDLDARLQALADEEDRESGAVMILSIADFARVNRLTSRSEGNAVLHELGGRLKLLQERYTGLIIARRQGADFTLFAPGISMEQGRELAAELLSLAVGLHWSRQADDPLTVHVGYTHHESFSDPAVLLREADAALGQARLQGVDCWHEFSGDTADLRVAHTPEEWRELLTRCIGQQGTTLEFQPMFNTDRALVGHEVYVRLRDDDEELLYPGTFLPAAERFGLVSAIDRMMLEALVAAITSQDPGLVVVNLSGGSAADATFRAWLQSFLQQHPALAKRLVFELPEYHLAAYGDDIARLQQSIFATGATVALDHFGRSNLALKYLHSLPLRYLKIHRSLVRGVESSSDQQVYIHALLQMARARDIQLFAEGVESADEFEMLVSLGVTVMEGYYLGRPASEPVS